MRRLLLASLLALAPGLAIAQTADGNANPNPPPPPGAFHGPMGGPDHGARWHPQMWSEYVLMKFYAANTSHDGHLTLAQAKAAAFTPVIDHFSQIDTAKRGYVTFYDIQAWKMDDMAKHLEARASALRAKDS